MGDPSRGDWAPDTVKPLRSTQNVANPLREPTSGFGVELVGFASTVSFKAAIGGIDSQGVLYRRDLTAYLLRQAYYTKWSAEGIAVTATGYSRLDLIQLKRELSYAFSQKVYIEDNKDLEFASELLEQRVYTDASYKRGEGSSWAWISEDLSAFDMGRMPDVKDNNIAEIVAVEQAHKAGYRSKYIYSDSARAVEQYGVQKIKAHDSMYGNTHADLLAKHARMASSNAVIIDTFTSLQKTPMQRVTDDIMRGV